MERDETDELDWTPTKRELILIRLADATPYIVGIALLLLAVVLGCRLAARVEAGSVGQWGDVLRAASETPNSARDGQ